MPNNIPKLRKEMLDRNYRPARAPMGTRVELEGGCLKTSATFTTSASKQEANADKRRASGSYYGERITLVTPTADTSTERPPGGLQSPPKSYPVSTPYSLYSDGQKRLHNQSLKDNAPTVHSITPRQSKLTWGER